MLKRLWQNYNLSIVLVVLFLSSWLAQWFFQWQEYVNNAKEHNQQAQMQEFIPEFGSATFENWQSEFLQLFTFVVLTTFLVHKGSHESKDSDEKLEQMVKEMQLDIKKLAKSKK